MIGNDDFYKYEFSVDRLVFLSFRGYLGEIEAGKESYNFSYTFFSIVQCCVRVSASNFQGLIRESGGARASGNFIRFLADPARIHHTYRYIRGDVLSSYLLTTGTI